MVGRDWSPDGDSDNSEPTGQRIARERKRRGLTQHGLANSAHISRSLIAQVEAGHKPASPSLVAAVARACGVEPAVLYGQPFRGSTKRTDAVHAAIPSIRRALAFMDLAPDLQVAARPLDELATELRQLQQLQGAAAHVSLIGRLPAAIEELTVQAAETDAPEAWGLLNHSYAIAISLARRLGYNDLAQVGIERAAQAAERADNPHLIYLGSLSRSLMLLTQGSPDIAFSVARRVAPQVDQSDPVGLEIFGALHLRAAVSAARMGNASNAWEHHGVAGEAISRIAPRDRRDPHGLQANPFNVAVHGCAIATDLGDFDRAISLDAEMSTRPSPKIFAERRAHHEIDIARTHLSLNQYDEALKRSLRADHIAPQMARFHPSARETARQLDRHFRRTPEPLRQLMTRMDL